MSRSKNTPSCVDCGKALSRPDAVRCHPCKVRHQWPGYDVDPVTGCHLWRGQLDRNGYGIAKVNRKTTTAHRAHWERMRGPLPPDTHLDHVKARGCCHRHCINLDHLEPVTRLENLHRSRTTRLTDDDVAQIRALEGTMTQEAIATRFGVSSSHVNNILRGRTRLT